MSIQVKQNCTPPGARIEVNSITARALAKAMWTNTSLTSLDLSSNGLDDSSGAYIARLLKRNTSLLSVSLGSNQLGPFACRAFGESLCTNKTLRCLNLESNQLTRDGEDVSGIGAMAEMFTRNTTITSVNLWRCALGGKAGAALSRGMESNSTIAFLEVGHNGLAMMDEGRIKTALDKNFQLFDESQAIRRQEQNVLDKVLAEEKELQEQLRADRQLREWLEDQKQMRAEERRTREENRCLSVRCP